MSTRPFDPSARLLRLPELTIEVDSSNQASVRVAGEAVACGAHGLTVLDLFSRPCSMVEALELLKPRIRGNQDWIDITSTIVRMHRQGLLRHEAQVTPTVPAGSSGWGGARVHISMLEDAPRVGGYLRAIREVVRPNDVVVDVGTGTGVLAIAAAIAGAKHVYAIEASSIGRVAQAMFDANGLAERITLVPGWSTQVELPERADVMVSEIIGDEPLDENVLEVVWDARRRLLTPDARIVPRRLRVLGLAVTLPEGEIARHVFTPAMARRWQEAYGIAFDPLVDQIEKVTQSFFVQPQRTRRWPVLSEGIVVADIDFTAEPASTSRREARVEATEAGTMNGLVVFFELEIGEGVWLSTHPQRADGRCSWRNVAWILPEPLALEPGSPFTVSYHYGGARGNSRVEVQPG